MSSFSSVQSCASIREYGSALRAIEGKERFTSFPSLDVWPVVLKTARKSLLYCNVMDKVVKIIHGYSTIMEPLLDAYCQHTADFFKLKYNVGA